MSARLSDASRKVNGVEPGALEPGIPQIAARKIGSTLDLNPTLDPSVLRRQDCVGQVSVAGDGLFNCVTEALRAGRREDDFALNVPYTGWSERSLSGCAEA
jgi:hypothetical protein